MRKPVVLLHVDDRRRDALTYVLLAKLLASMGNNVFLCNRATNKLYWNQLQPDVMVVPYTWTGVKGPEEMAHRARRTRMVLLPTEGMPIGFGNFASGLFDRQGTVKGREYASNLTKALMWGEAGKREVLGTGWINEDVVSVVGCPRFDLFYPEAKLKQLVAEDAQPSIGFVGGFSGINVFDQRSIFGYIDDVRRGYAAAGTNGHAEEPFWWGFAAVRIYLDILDQWILERKRLAKYRPHPFEYFGSYSYLETKYGKQFTLDHPLNPFPLWLASVAAIVVPGVSSTALQAFITGKPAISTHLIMDNPFPSLANRAAFNTPFQRFSLNPRTAQETTDLLETAVRGELKAADTSDPELAALLRDQLDWPRDSFALSSVAREIDSVAKEAADSGHAGPTPANLLKAKVLPYGLWTALQFHLWKHRHSPGRKQLNELSRFWPWHRYEWRIGEQLFRIMLPKMKKDLTTGPRSQVKI